MGKEEQMNQDNALNVCIIAKWMRVVLQDMSYVSHALI